MKTTFFKLSLSFLFAVICVNSVMSQTYTLVWQDDFCGPSLDASVWNIEVRYDGGGNNELQYYTDRTDNVSIGIEPVSGKSCLILTAKKETYGTGGNQRTATSGRVNTLNKMYVQYGKIEARIKLPKTANGLWPAFWMLGSNINDSGFGWPTCGEIDILEMGNAAGISAGTQERYFNGALHWGYYTSGNYPNYGNHVTNAYSLQDDFHLYTLEWDANSIKMYLDKDKYPSVAPYYQMNITGTNDDRGGQYAGYNYFRHPFFIVFNLAVGGNFPGIFNINNVTALNAGDAKMYIDYVKVYQKNDAGQSYFGPAGQTTDCVAGPTVPVTGVSLKNSTTLLDTGTEQLTATVSPSSATDKRVTWSSSNTNVATVSNTGLVTAKTAGTATITATTADGGKTAACVVTVQENVCKTNILATIPLTLGNVFFTQDGVENWAPSTNYNAAWANNELTIRLGNATVGEWHAQIPLVAAETALTNGKAYLLSFTIQTDKALPRVYMKAQRDGQNDNFVDVPPLNIPVGTTTVKYISTSSATGFNRVLFDFGGNPANTNITISNIQICGDYGACINVTTQLRDTICLNESYNKNGFSLPVQTTAGKVNDLLMLKTAQNCDSIVRLELVVKVCIPGCTDETATNYNPAATNDDGSCTFTDCSAVLEQVQSLKTDTVALHAQIRELQKQLETVQTQLNTANGSISQKDGIIGNLNTQITDLENGLNDCSGIVTAKDGIIGNQNTKITDLENGLNDCNGIVTAKDGIIGNQNTKIANQNTEIANLKSDTTNLKGQISVLTNEKADLQESLDACISNDTDALVESLQNQLTTANGTISQKDGIIGNLNTKITGLENDLSNCNGIVTAKDGIIGNQNTKIANQNTEIANLKSDTTNLKGQISVLTNEKTDLQESLDACISNNTDALVESLQNQLTTANGTITQKDGIIGNKNAEIANLNDEIANLELLLKNCAGDPTDLLAQIASLSSKIANLESDTTQLRNSIANLETDLSDCETENATLIIQVENLQTQLDNCGTTDTQNLRSSGIQIFPNPTTGIVNVSKASELKVYSLQGALLYETFGTQVDLSTYPQGVYQLHINGDVVRVVKK
ncbi:MAG: family 16 glycosylhydrolase [Bacteroidetes bacterium]|nr:family 16 glycosylhydrolase [Bacteroidota bacterium]